MSINLLFRINFFFLLAFLPSFSPFLLAEEEQKQSDQSILEQNNSEQIKVSIVINKNNWQDHSEYLLEPIAKLINTGRFELAKSASNLDPSNSQNPIPHLTPLSAISFNSITKYELTSTGLIRNDSVASLVWSVLEDKTSLSSVIFNSPEYLRDWFYIQNITLDNPKFHIHTAINKCREAHFENNTNELLSGPISFDDILFPVLRGHQSYDSQYTEREVQIKKLYVPDYFSQADELALSDLKVGDLNVYISNLNQSNAGILEKEKLIETSTPKKKLLLNSAQTRFGVRLSLVSIIERKPKSIYSEISREILVLDSKNKLPLVKLVYGIKNNFLRGVFYYWGKVKNFDREYDIPNSIISFDKQGASLIEIQRLLAFENYSVGFLDNKIKQICSAQ